MQIEDMNWLMTCYNDLSDSIKKHNNSHAILISGEAGIGRKILAQKFAENYLNITQDITDDLINNEIKEPQHPDFKFIKPEDGKKNISIDQIRPTKAFLQLTSHQGIGKVAIICPAESMTYEAMNSLLKILEEPSNDTLIILITESIKKLPQTIVSRSQIQNLRNPSLKESIKWLNKYDEKPWKDILITFGNRPIIIEKLGFEYFDSRIKQVNEDIDLLVLKKSKPSQIANTWKSEELDIYLSILYKLISNLINQNLLNIKESMPTSFKNIPQSDIHIEQCFQYLNEIATMRQYLINGKVLNWGLQISNLLVPIYSDMKGLIKNG